MKLFKTKAGFYSVSFVSREGKTITRSLKTKSKAEASALVKEAKIEQIEMAAKANALTKDTIALVTGGIMSIADVQAEYKRFRELKSHSVHSMYSEETIVNSFLEENNLSDANIDDITKEQIFATVNKDNKASLNHKRKQITAIRGLISFAIANGYILKDPTYGIVVDKSKLSVKQKEPKRKIPFTEEDYDIIRKNCSYFWSIAADFAWWTGLRMSDIAQMEWDSFSENNLIVHTVKTDTRVALPYDDPLIGGGILRDTIARIEPDDEKYCFPKWNWFSNDEKARATLPTYFARELKRKHPKAFEEGKRFHSFRRAFVTRCKKAGKSLEDIATWVGHSDTRTTEIYDQSS